MQQEATQCRGNQKPNYLYMEQWGECLKLDSPVISGSKDRRLDLAHSSTMRHNIMLKLNNNGKDNFNTKIMSVEELKIPEELETEIERDLEGEIKDDIYTLALRLHRLYQHKKWRNKPSSSTTKFGFRSESNNDILTEVIIAINMIGGSKIEVSESKRAASNVIRPRSSRLEAKPGREFSCSKRFDWPKSLRSGTGCVVKSMKYANSNIGTDTRDGRSFTGGSSQTGKGHSLGWRI